MELVPYALRRGRRTAAFTGFVMALLIVIAVAIYVASPAGSGEGYRFYYLATVGIALIVAAALKTSGKSVMAILTVFMIALALWQSSAAAEWTRASRVIEGAPRTMTPAATTLAPSEFGLVLLPDMMGHVPAAGNAQGALLTLKDGRSPARDFFIIFTSPQLAEWHQLAHEDVVKKLTQRVTEPPQITRYYCFNSSNLSRQDLGYRPSGTLSEWSAHWRKTIADRCPDLSL